MRSKNGGRVETGSWAGWVLPCYALCYGVMKNGKRGVNLGGVMGLIGFVDGGFGKE
jgi:hypothetical protein